MTVPLAISISLNVILLFVIFVLVLDLSGVRKCIRESREKNDELQERIDGTHFQVKEAAERLNMLMDTYQSEREADGQD